MKIALFSYRGNPFCGGQGVYLRGLSRALAERGHRIHVFTGPPYPGEMPWAVVHRLPNENFINRPASQRPKKNSAGRYDRLDLLEYGLARCGANPEMLGQSLRLYARLKELQPREKFDLLHDNQSLGYGLLLLRRLGLPVVSTIHHPLGIDRREDIRQTAGVAAKLRRAAYYPWVMQGLVARRLDGVITVSDFAGELVRGYYRLHREKLTRVYNGVDADFFSPSPTAAKIAGRLIFVGSTEDRKKGIKFLLEALVRLSPPAHLVIVDGRLYPGRVYAKNLVRELGLAARVIWREQISDLELREEYRRAEIAVTPSLFEGFGLPALEAMACGLPVVSSDAGALSEVVGRNSGAIVPAGNAEALAGAIAELSADPARREQAGRAARERAAEFSWARAAEQTEAVYRRVIAAGVPAQSSAGRRRS